ncbi:VanZ family protein [Microbacterium sp. W4I20]|uniref:VanZ family protein n=1 Tax=Microbacterium sp. W4I20 TaxID=3042262 RepID=UPI002788A8B6|nr:VanZ family protein [Microbacterium sp. W4I20]MDQ0726294.1 glycopeptide antibiotics resistance protein [Microbacterium sp. W4I20]
MPPAPAATRTLLRPVVAKVLLAGYLLFVGFTVWLPAVVSAKVTGLVGLLARWVAAAGIASYQSSAVVLEYLANVALFVPIGALLLFAWPRLRLWQVVLIGALLSGLIETVQGLMPSRYPTISDVMANTLGTLIGGAIIAAFLTWWRPAGGRRAVGWWRELPPR